MTQYIKYMQQTATEYSRIATGYTFFSAAHGTFSKVDHILGHKASLHEYKKSTVISYIVSDHKWNKTRNQQQDTHQEIYKKRGIRKHLELVENENTSYQNLWNTEKAVYNHKILKIR
jgi:hypothetical protein